MSLGLRYCSTKLSSRYCAQAVRSASIQSPLPAISGNQSRSSAVGSVQMRRMSFIMANPSAYGLMPEKRRSLKVGWKITEECECRNSSIVPSVSCPRS